MQGRWMEPSGDLHVYSIFLLHYVGWGLVGMLSVDIGCACGEQRADHAETRKQKIGTIIGRYMGIVIGIHLSFL